MESDRPAWDAKLAEAMIGARVLIGLTRRSAEGDRLEQMYGTIVSAHPSKGFAVELAGTRSGETYHLPPDLRGFFKAPPGEYRLRSTQEVVIDPEFTSSWTIDADK